MVFPRRSEKVKCTHFLGLTLILQFLSHFSILFTCYCWIVIEAPSAVSLLDIIAVSSAYVTDWNLISKNSIYATKMIFHNIFLHFSIYIYFKRINFLFRCTVYPPYVKFYYLICMIKTPHLSFIVVISINRSVIYFITTYYFLFKKKTISVLYIIITFIKFCMLNIFF